ncbi:MAG TPA: hypothetical protein VEF89_03785 [Solirubrobacteraceae bacterium]|nr:hypothetical protein [Solirubrobacteraceae bacterium]
MDGFGEEAIVRPPDGHGTVVQQVPGEQHVADVQHVVPVQQDPVGAQQGIVAPAVSGGPLGGTGQHSSICGQTSRGESRAAPAGAATARTGIVAAARKSEIRTIERRIGEIRTDPETPQA